MAQNHLATDDTNVHGYPEITFAVQEISGGVLIAEQGDFIRAELRLAAAQVTPQVTPQVLRLETY